MRKVVVFIDSDPSVGGSYYYNRAILKAASVLPLDKYKVIVIYTNKNWDIYINGNVEKIYVQFGKFYKILLQFILMIGIPLSVICYIVNRINHVAKTIIEQKPDICVFPSQEAFWGYITKVRSIVAIHDLMHRYERKYKEVSNYGKYIHKENHFINICKHSIGIMVDSELGKRHVHESYQFPLENIYVLPYIPQESINNGDNNIDINKYKLPSKYILYPAQFWPHKNHIRLIKAIYYLKNDLPDIHLVLVGSKKNEYKSVAKLVLELNLDDVVLFMGYVPERDLMEFYKRATAMVMPTFFGPTNIPPLEAFAVGCPVAVSNVYGMPELVGDAGLLFDPTNVEDIANVIKRLWLQDDLRQQLIQNGLYKSKQWGQEEFNNKLFQIIEHATGR